MFSRLSLPILNFVVPLVSSIVVEDDSVNLLQTTVHKHLISDTPQRCVAGIPDKEKKKCVIKGDPHIKMWSQPDEDGARLGLYGTYADYWLVNTEQLKVMGRIGGVEQFDMGVVKGVAISGSLLNNKVLIIPTTNNGPITFDGAEVSLASGPIMFNDDCLNMSIGEGPNWNTFGAAIHATKLRPNTISITIGSMAAISLNQDVFQHLEVLADESLLAEDKGLCTSQCHDWFNCQDPICDLTKSLFTTKHPQCGTEIVRVPCNPLRLKLAKADCAKQYEGKEKSAAMAVQNCIEDCCSARDQCPDRGAGDGKATCLIFGDPHIKGFDAKEASKHTFSPVGTHWLVNSDFVKIQSNYVTSSFVKAQMEGIGFTGAIVSDVKDGKHSVIFFRHSRHGAGVTINDKVVMDGTSDKLYEDPDGGHFNITFGKGHDIPELLKDARPIPLVDNVYTLTFFQGAKFLIHQGAGLSIYMSIDSRLLSGVSGECGNFNGDPLDDGHKKIDTANTDCVTKSEFFIPYAAECSAVPIKPGCDKGIGLMKFQKQCKRALGMKMAVKKMTEEARNLLKDCMEDCCLGGTCPDKNANPTTDQDF